MKKADLFVCSPKNYDVTIDVVTTDIHAKLMRSLQHRLSSNGFTDVTVDTIRTTTNIVLTDAELKLLKSNPIYLSEHYLSKPIILDPNIHAKITRMYTAPYLMRPNLGEYRYCHNGQIPVFHFAFIGALNSGKSYVMHEFRALLTELCGDLNFIKCYNPWENPAIEDFQNEPEFLAICREHIKGNAIMLGNGPNYRVNFDDVLESNTRI